MAVKYDLLEHIITQVVWVPFPLLPWAEEPGVQDPVFHYIFGTAAISILL